MDTEPFNLNVRKRNTVGRVPSLTRIFVFMAFTGFMVPVLANPDDGEMRQLAKMSATLHVGYWGTIASMEFCIEAALQPETKARYSKILEQWHSRNSKVIGLLLRVELHELGGDKDPEVRQLVISNKKKRATETTNDRLQFMQSLTLAELKQLCNRFHDEMDAGQLDLERKYPKAYAFLTELREKRGISLEKDQ